MKVFFGQLWSFISHRFILLVVGTFFTWGVMTMGWTNSDLGYCWAALPQGDAVTNPMSILRLALPVDNQAIHAIHQYLEEMPAQLDDPTARMQPKQWSGVGNQISKAIRTFNGEASDLLSDIPTPYRPQALVRMNQINAALADLKILSEEQSKDQFVAKRTQAWNAIDLLAASMVPEHSINIPEDYQTLPQLNGRAVVVLDTSKGPITIMVDGYNAPITAGNFLDLVQREFYDELTFTREDEAYVVQAGNPEGSPSGFVDPDTGQYRSIPLEVMVKGDSEPVYGATLEELGLSLSEPVLPFSAYGTVAMGHPQGDPNGGSSQFFFHLFEPDLTPAGLNLLDGRYAVFGYVIAGQEVLAQLQHGDLLRSAKVVDISPPNAFTFRYLDWILVQRLSSLKAMV
ncbi:peptidylprolyl isomerase [Acaryochloris sp. IP29b_bin.137]|uniref:peptidylprolyl isomerase n=1 Tax=Acaryochloris sp. IP29b_bin.137 TaxID=2969217 RepID=UPI002609F1BA|nr:peptidylprolyl isomerase [Acaryochloris sp. IP29b_bin.137]